MPEPVTYEAAPFPSVLPVSASGVEVEMTRSISLTSLPGAAAALNATAYFWNEEGTDSLSSPTASVLVLPLVMCLQFGVDTDAGLNISFGHGQQSNLSVLPMARPASTSDPVQARWSATVSAPPKSRSSGQAVLRQPSTVASSRQA